MTYQWIKGTPPNKATQVWWYSDERSKARVRIVRGPISRLWDADYGEGQLPYEGARVAGYPGPDSALEALHRLALECGEGMDAHLIMRALGALGGAA